MATVYADANGKILFFAASTFIANQNPAPNGTVFTIQIDEISNGPLVADIQVNLNLYAAPGGVLQKSSVTQTINAATGLSLGTTLTPANLGTAIQNLKAGTVPEATLQSGLADLLWYLHEKGII